MKSAPPKEINGHVTHHGRLSEAKKVKKKKSKKKKKKRKKKKKKKKKKKQRARKKVLPLQKSQAPPRAANHGCVSKSGSESKQIHGRRQAGKKRSMRERDQRD